MKVMVVGATGVLGRNVIPRLVERGHAVHAVVRRDEQARFLQHAGANPIEGDIFDVDSLRRATHGCDIALHLATAIPKPGEHDWSLNDRIRREGTRNLLDAAAANGVKRYIQQSIALLYGDNGHDLVNETAPLRPAPVIQSASDMEAMVRAAALDWCILRGGLFYGPGTGPDDAWRKAAADGSMRLPGDGSALLSLVHVVDMARAVVVAAENAPCGSIYNVVDDDPVSFKRLFGYVAAQLRAPEPVAGGPTSLPSLGCTNTRIKGDLPWQPSYATYRSGLA